MLDEILRFLMTDLLRFALRIVLFPLALVICTPFIVIRAVILALRHRETFTRAVADGYYAIDVAWWN